MTELMPTTTEPTFSPSLGLRFWMNKMKPATESALEEDKQRTSSMISHNDAPSVVSDMATTRSYPFDKNSSLRVLHHPNNNDTCSDRSSYLSEDIQSTASIKSKPWISQAVPHEESFSSADQQQQQHKRRWSENELFPLGRIKAGLGRLVLGREHSSPPTASH